MVTRGQKLLGGIGIGLILIGVAYAAVRFGQHYMKVGATGVGAARNACMVGVHQARQVVFASDQVSPAHTEAEACDTLTITNQDDVARTVSFGPKGHVAPYDEVSSKKLAQGESFRVTLMQTGNFTFLDQNGVTGTFTVEP